MDKLMLFFFPITNFKVIIFKNFTKAKMKVDIPSPRNSHINLFQLFQFFYLECGTVINKFNV